jgi:hypothetical protein
LEDLDKVREAIAAEGDAAFKRVINPLPAPTPKKRKTGVVSTPKDSKKSGGKSTPKGKGKQKEADPDEDEEEEENDGRPPKRAKKD